MPRHGSYRYRSPLRRWLDEPIDRGVYSRPLTRGEVVIPLALFGAMFVGSLVLIHAPWLVGVLVVGLVGWYLRWLIGEWRRKAEFERGCAWRRAHPEVTDAMLRTHAPWMTGQKWE